MAAYDLVVIGTGTAAATVAHRLRREGWSVAILDKRPFGGTCVLRGCDPKKVLVGVAELMDWNKRMQDKGIAGENVHLDWPSLIRFKRTFTDPVPERRERSFQRAGIAAFHGIAKFVDPQTIQIGNHTLTVYRRRYRPSPANSPDPRRALSHNQRTVPSA